MAPQNNPPTVPSEDVVPALPTEASAEASASLTASCETSPPPVPASRLESVSRALDRGLSYVVAVLLVLMSATVFGNVICRYVLDASLAWYEEVSRFLLLWIVFLGAVIAFIRGDHLGIDVLVHALPRRARAAVVVFADVLVLFALAIMFQGGWEMAQDSLDSGWVASSVPIPYGYVYMVGPISAGLMFIHALIKTIRDVRTREPVAG